MYIISVLLNRHYFDRVGDSPCSQRFPSIMLDVGCSKLPLRIGFRAGRSVVRGQSLRLSGPRRDARQHYRRSDACAFSVVFSIVVTLYRLLRCDFIGHWIG